MDVFTLAKIARLRLIFLDEMPEKENKQTEEIFRLHTNNNFTTQWRFDEDGVQRQLVTETAADCREIALFLENLAFASDLTPSIKDIKPVQQYFRNNFLKCLIMLDARTVHGLLKNMRSLGILNFIQYRKILALLFREISNFEPNFHAREKLELYKSFIGLLENKEDVAIYTARLPIFEETYKTQYDQELEFLKKKEL